MQDSFQQGLAGVAGVVGVPLKLLHHKLQQHALQMQTGRGLWDLKANCVGFDCKEKGDQTASVATMIAITIVKCRRATTMKQRSHLVLVTSLWNVSARIL